MDTLHLTVLSTVHTHINPHSISHPVPAQPLSPTTYIDTYPPIPFNSTSYSPSKPQSHHHGQQPSRAYGIINAPITNPHPCVPGHHSPSPSTQSGPICRPPPHSPRANARLRRRRRRRDGVQIAPCTSCMLTIITIVIILTKLLHIPPRSSRRLNNNNNNNNNAPQPDKL